MLKCRNINVKYKEEEIREIFREVFGVTDDLLTMIFHSLYGEQWTAWNNGTLENDKNYICFNYPPLQIPFACSLASSEDGK